MTSNDCVIKGEDFCLYRRPPSKTFLEIRHAMNLAPGSGARFDKKTGKWEIIVGDKGIGWTRDRGFAEYLAQRYSIGDVMLLSKRDKSKYADKLKRVI